MRLPSLRLRLDNVPEAKAWAALLAAWSGLWLAVVVYFDSDLTRVLAVALLTATATLGLVRLWAFSGLVVGGVSALLYAAVAIMHVRNEGGALTVALPGAVAFLLGAVGAGLLADALAARTERDELQRQTDSRMIEELTPTVADTEVMKWEHARRVLGEELARGRRYGQKLTLALVGVDDWAEFTEEQGAAVARETQLRLAGIAQEIVRPTDKVAMRNPGEVVMLLTHTNLPGAQRACDRVRQAIRNSLELQTRAGLAEFPDDAVDVEGLVREADFALAFARQSGLNVASRSLLDRA